MPLPRRSGWTAIQTTANWPVSQRSAPSGPTAWRRLPYHPSGGISGVGNP
jgi:hypothetical protein